jgi:membrane dipeptidase
MDNRMDDVRASHDPAWGGDRGWWLPPGVPATLNVRQASRPNVAAQITKGLQMPGVRFFVPVFALIVAAIPVSGQAVSPPRAEQQPAAGSAAEQELVERARLIHSAVITIDTHADIPGNFGTPEYNPCNALNRQVDVPKMTAGGLDAAFFIVYVGQATRTPENYARAKAEALRKFEGIRRVAYEFCPDRIELAYTAADVERIHASGKLVAAIGIENGFVLGTDVSLLRRYYELGARYMSLTHNGHNDLADSWLPDPRIGDTGFEHNGLSALGEQVVAELNRLGIMVDVSHASKAATLHLARISKAPLIASHSGVRAIASTERNMDDEMMRALAATGGVMQTVALGSFVQDVPQPRQEALQALRAEYRLGAGRRPQDLTSSERAAYTARMAEIDAHWPPATVADFVDHIDYAVRLIGIDHVGISSDFDGGGGIVGWNNAAETFNVTLELVRRGYGEAEIRKLWGGNLLRVWRATESAARSLQAEQ